MNHLTEEQLVEHYFAEGANRLGVETHLRICSRCEQAYEEIFNALVVRAPEPPAREPGYGKRLWKSIQAPLRPYPATKRRSFSWPRFVLTSACLLVLGAAFFVGALWQRSRTHLPERANPALAKERVILFILGDHLDRSERLLVELNHAGGAEGAPASSLQSEARQLLPDNRLYRQALSSRNDPMMAAALDHLERVLLEVANSPDKLNSAELERIEQEMNTDSLLFQIRVLRARTLQHERQVEPARKGSSI